MAISAVIGGQRFRFNHVRHTTPGWQHIQRRGPDPTHFVARSELPGRRRARPFMRSEARYRAAGFRVSACKLQISQQWRARRVLRLRQSAASQCQRRVYPGRCISRYVLRCRSRRSHPAAFLADAAMRGRQQNNQHSKRQRHQRHGVLSRLPANQKLDTPHIGVSKLGCEDS